MLEQFITRILVLWHEEDGQDFIEYALLALLIALAVTATIILVGNQLNVVYNNIVTALQGT